MKYNNIYNLKSLFYFHAVHFSIVSLKMVNESSKHVREVTF
jgi:hypothetical protein